MPSTSNTAMRIDVDAVLRERLPRHAHLIPRPVVEWLKRILCQDGLNRLLKHNSELRGSDFCRGILSDLDVSYRVVNADNIPAPEERRVTYVSNHPLGGLDGMALIKMLAERHGVEPYFVVNDLLSVITPLNGNFVPINKLGSQSRDATRKLSEAFGSDRPVIVFPAGLVSRKSKGGDIHDLSWHKMFINKSIETGRDIIPLFFSGRNSNFFYNFAKLRTRIGLKFNFEMLLLPREVFRSNGSRYEIIAGRRIGWQSLRGGREAEDEASRICELVYSLSGTQS